MKRYLMELSFCIAAYVAACVLAMWLLNGHGVAASWRPVVALLPMIPGVGLCPVIVRQFRRVDEMERRIQFESLVFAFAGTAIVTFSYGFLETVGFARLSMFWVWGIMAAFWVAGYVVSRRRYL